MSMSLTESMKHQTILYTTIGILAGALLLWGGWFFYTTFATQNEEQSNSPSEFSFGDTGADSGNSSGNFNRNETMSTSSTSGVRSQPALWLVSEGPVSAATTYATKERSDTNRAEWFIRFVERTTGHVYEQSVLERRNVRISNKTVPGIQEAFWLPGNPDVYVVRFLNETLESIRTFVATLAPKVDENNEPIVELQENSHVLGGVFLENNVLEATPAPVADQLFYLVRLGGETQGIIFGPGTSKRTLFSTPLTELLPRWTSQGDVLVTTKASYNVPGTSFTVNTSSGSFEHALGAKSTLMSILSPDGQKIVYTSREEGTELSYLQTLGGEKQLLPFVLLPEKCIWGHYTTTDLYCSVPNSLNSTGEPDTWYQGVTSFTDLVWKIDTNTLTTTLLAQPADFARFGLEDGIDGIGLALDREDEFLTLINKKDGSLWAIRLHDPVLRNDGRGE